MMLNRTSYDVIVLDCGLLVNRCGLDNKMRRGGCCDMKYLRHGNHCLSSDNVTKGTYQICQISLIYLILSNFKVS